MEDCKAMLASEADLARQLEARIAGDEVRHLIVLPCLYCTQAEL